MLGVIVAALMAGSFFLPWAEFLGEPIGPTLLIEDGLTSLADLSWQGMAFVASFALAAVAAVLALIGRSAGLLMLIAGAIPFALIAQQVMSARDQVQDLGLPMPRLNDPMAAFDMIREIMAIGLPVYFVSAALLVLIGLGRAVRGA